MKAANRATHRLASLVGAALLLACAACSRPTAKSATATPAAHLTAGAADLGPYLRAFIAENQIPGMTAVVLRGDRILAEGAAGVRKAGSPELILIDDPFHLGSVTKSMTATLAATFVEEGRLKWSTTLPELFPRVSNMDPGWRNVTVRQMLAHCSGLPANYPWLLRVNHQASKLPLEEQRREIVSAVLSKSPDYPPGSKMVYSNTAFVLLGAALEGSAGRPWETLMQERIFSPLGLQSAGFGWPGTRGKTDAPWGHGILNRPKQTDNPAAMGPAGAVHMNIRDWAKFVAVHLRGDPANPHREARLLKPETFEWLHTPAPGENHLAGWVTERRTSLKGSRPTDSGKVLWHNGSNGAWYAVMVIAPEIDAAVLIATNRHDRDAARACDACARALLEFYREPPTK